MRSSNPWSLSKSMMCSIIGLLAIGIIGFGTLLVSGRSRVPKPPAMMTAFTGVPPSPRLPALWQAWLLSQEYRSHRQKLSRRFWQSRVPVARGANPHCASAYRPVGDHGGSRRPDARRREPGHRQVHHTILDVFTRQIPKGAGTGCWRTPKPFPWQDGRADARLNALRAWICT